MHAQFVIPALLCVAGLVLLADQWPFDIDWTGDQEAESEEDLAISEDSRNAMNVNKGAASTSMM